MQSQQDVFQNVREARLRDDPRAVSLHVTVVARYALGVTSKTNNTRDPARYTPGLGTVSPLLP